MLWSVDGVGQDQWLLQTTLDEGLPRVAAGADTNDGGLELVLQHQNMLKNSN